MFVPLILHQFLQIIFFLCNGWFLRVIYPNFTILPSLELTVLATISMQSLVVNDSRQFSKHVCWFR